MRSYKAQGIIIKRDNLGEADRLVTLFTDRFGKIKVIAKGARRPRSRMASSTDLFCEIEFVAARTRSIDILTESKILSSHCDIGSQWAKTKNAYWVGELINQLTHDEEPNPKLYQLLSEVLKIINHQKTNLIVDYFIYHCLSLLGYKPELTDCAKTGKKLSCTDKLYFSPAAGGVICLPDTKAIKVNPDTIKALRYLAHSWDDVKKLRLPSDIAREVHHCLKDFAEYVTEKEIKSDKL